MLFTSLAHSQSDTNQAKINVKAAYHRGFLIPHRISMQHIPKELTNGVEVCIERSSQNQSDWEKLYNNPTIGLSVLFTSVGNYDILGNALGVQPYMLIPIVKTEHFNLQTSWGWGLGYLSKHFDAESNNQNIAIGSGFNLFASIQLRSEIFFDKRNALMIGAAYNHWSNSGIQFPNLGLNVPTLNVGFEHKFHTEERFSKMSKAEKKLLKPTTKNEIVIMPTVGFRAYSVHDNSVSPAYAFTMHFARLWSQKYKVSAGLDLLYNTAMAKHLKNEGSDSTAIQTGINATYHQTIGSFSIIVGMGAYVFDQTLNDEVLYHRFGTRFMVGDDIVVTTNLFTHWARADHLEIGVGYKIRK